MDGPEVTPWMKTMKDEYLSRYDCNVFIADWTSGNKGSYEQVTANTRVVGAVIAIFLKNLMVKNFKAHKIN